MLRTTAEAEGEVRCLHVESIYFYWSFQGGTFVVVFVVICLGVKFLYYLNLMYVFHIFS